MQLRRLPAAILLGLGLGPVACGGRVVVDSDGSESGTGTSGSTGTTGTTDETTTETGSTSSSSGESEVGPCLDVDTGIKFDLALPDVAPCLDPTSTGPCLSPDGGPELETGGGEVLDSAPAGEAAAGPSWDQLMERLRDRLPPDVLARLPRGRR